MSFRTKIWNFETVCFVICFGFLYVNFSILQIAAAVSVSTGCISYGICIAYTSPAIPSMLELNHTTSLTNMLGAEETSWMSKKNFYFYPSAFPLAPQLSEMHQT